MSTFRQRTIVITGGGGGIGRATALLCARRGEKIAILDIDESAARRTAEEAMGEGAPAALGLRCDVSCEDEVEASFARVASELGDVYGLFANAAIAGRGAIHELDLAVWQKILAVNLTGIFLSAKYMLRDLLKNDVAGSIVCTSSPAADVAFSGGGAAPYSASKGGVSAFVRCLAIDYARYGIRANALVPGSTETQLMWGETPKEEVQRIRNVLSREIPLGRLALPEEPAEAVAWLLSDASRYVTGSHLVCDGGILAKASVST